jgi:hypothetical protein
MPVTNARSRSYPRFDQKLRSGDHLVRASTALSKLSGWPRRPVWDLLDVDAVLKQIS